MKTKSKYCLRTIVSRFRLGTSPAIPRTSPADRASSSVIADSFLLIGLEALTGGKPAFLNFSRSLLVGDYALLLPREQTVIELLETIEPDDEVVSACRGLKDAGYTLALDDFAFAPKYETLLELADILKIDFLATRDPERQRLADKYGSRMQLLAEKVETHEDFRQGQQLGYKYFQGYFFCKPEIVAKPHVWYKNLHRFTKNFIAGQVLKDGDVASGVTVTLKGADSTAVLVSDMFGEFRFDALSDGDYTLAVEGKELAKVAVRGASVDAGDFEI